MNINVEQEDFFLSIEVKTKENFIREAVKLAVIINPFWTIGVSDRIPDIRLFLKSLPKKNTFFLGGSSRIINSQIDKKGSLLLWVPSSGSFIKTDFRKGIAKGEFAHQDPSITIMLKQWLNLCLLITSSVKLHSAAVRIAGEKTLLLIGESNSGKSTLSAILKRYFDYKIINDDLVFLIPQRQKIYLFSINFILLDNSAILFNKEIANAEANFYGLPKWIIFVKREESGSASKIIPLSYKEAFTTICFYSEFPLKENVKRQQRRLGILSNIIKQCKCFRLISRRDIKENPSRLKYLLSHILS